MATGALALERAIVPAQPAMLIEGATAAAGLRDPRMANTVSHAAYTKSSQSRDAAQLTLEEWRRMFAGRVEHVEADRLYVVRLDTADGELKLGLVATTGPLFNREAPTDEGTSEVVPHIRSLWFKRCQESQHAWGKNPAFEPFAPGGTRAQDDLPVDSFLVEVTKGDLTEAGLAKKWTHPKFTEAFMNEKLRWVAERYGLLHSEPKQRLKRKRSR